MKTMEIFETLKVIFYKTTGNYDLELTPEMQLDRDLCLSSFGKIQLICAIEDCYGIEIPNKALRRFKTINDIIKYLEKNT